MKLLTIFCLASFTFVSAQEIENKVKINPVPVVMDYVSSKPVSNVIVLPFLYDNKLKLAKKKSYKNIIENTLSGEKYLIFKVKRSTKIC